MRLSAMFLLVALGIIAAFGAGTPVHARTPTPAATPTATPTLSPTASPQQIAIFQGAAWVDARASSGPVVAKIGDVDCNSEPSSAGIPPDGGGVIYGVSVLSSQVKAGCGQEGSVVIFFVEGKQAEQTGVWHAHTEQFINLIAGPPFAAFGGSPGIASMPAGESILPFIGGQACGNFKLKTVVGGAKAYDVHVYSADQQQGCGTEGAQVAFKLVDAQGNVLATANQTGIWHAWDGVSPLPKLDLTFGPASGIKMGNTGTGDGPQGGADAWGTVAIALWGVGLGGIAAGVALRRKTATR